MIITKDEFGLEFFYNGMDYSEMVKGSSKSYVKDLQKYKLIKIKSAKKVFLTDRGRLAKNIDIKKFLEIEEFEKELTNNKKEVEKDFILISLMSVLLFIITCGSIYISW